MALTRPTFDQTLSTKIEITDPVVMINKGGNTARDLGFLIDRSYLAQSNVAIIFKHSDQTLYFVTTDGSGNTDGAFTVNTRVDVNTGNIYSSNITATGITASNISANYFIGNGSTLTGIVSGNIVGQVANALVAGTVYTNSQPNITSVGNLTSLTLSGPVTGNIIPSANITYDLGNISNRYRDLWLSNSTIYLGNVTISATDTKLKINDIEVLSLYTLSDVNGANVSGQVANALVAGTVYTNAQPNITSVGTLTSLTVSGNINSGNLDASIINASSITGTLTTAAQPNITSVGNLTSLSVVGNIAAGNLTTDKVVSNLLTGTLTTPSQPNVTSVGSLVSLDVTGNISAGNISGTLITGTLATSAQPNITDLGTLNSLSVTGNITGGNLSGSLVTGTLVTSSQPNITDLGTLNSLSVTGNISGGNLSGALVIGTLVTAAQPNVTSLGTLNSLSVTGNITGGNLSGSLITGTLATAAQPNITSLGELTSLSVTGNVTAGNVSGSLLTGTLTTAAQPNITSVGSLTSLSVIGNISAGNVSGTLLTGTLTTAAQPNITSVGSLSSLSVIGNVSASYYNGSGSLLESLTGANVTGQVANALIAGTVYTNSQPNITSVGTLTGLTVSGSASFGNLGASQAVNITDTTNAAGVGTGALIVAGGASVGKDLYVLGNVYTSNLVAISSSELSVQDPLLYLTANTPYPYSFDIGFYSHFIGGAGNTYQHTGLVRNHTNNQWYLFSNLPEPSGGTVDLANIRLIYDTLRLGDLIASGNITSGNASLGNLATANYFSGDGSLLTSVAATTAITVTSAAQPAITSVGTLTSLAVSGNISAGNVSGTLLTGTLATAAQPNITSLGTLSGLSVTGNITAGNVSGTLLTGTLATSAQPNVTSVGTLTSLSVTGNITSGNVSGTLLTGTLTTATQPNITSVGSLTSLSVVGNITAGNVSGTLITGTLTTAAQPNITSVGSLTSLSVTGNVTAGNLSGTLLTGTLATAAQPNITSVGTLTSLIVSGNVTISSNLTTAAGTNANLVIDPDGTGWLTATSTTPVSFQNALVVTGNITSSSGNFIGNGALLTGLPAGYANTNVASYLPTYSGNIGGTLTTAAQPYVTSVGTLSSLSVTANVTAAAATYTGNVSVGSLITTGNIVGTTAVGINTTANANLTLNAGAGQIITSSGIQNGQANTVGNIGNTTGYFNTIFASSAVYSGSVNAGSIVNNNANTVGNIGSTTGYFNTIFSVAAVHSGTVTTAGLVNAGAAGTGNIGAVTGGFNTVFAKATSAQYADLAEIYQADDKYEPGTVVVFGGDKEITMTNVSHDSRAAGVISTNPAYLMNDQAKGLPVALTGRVPCWVIGPVEKGTVLTTSTKPGFAEALMRPLYQPGCVIGKSLGTVPAGEFRLIEVVVGRF